MAALITTLGAITIALISLWGNRRTSQVRTEVQAVNKAVNNVPDGAPTLRETVESHTELLAAHTRQLDELTATANELTATANDILAEVTKPAPRPPALGE